VIRLDAPLVVGSGVAGLSVALGLPRAVVLTLGPLGSTGWAQGGIAAALGSDDAPSLHAEDTMTVSAGLAVREAVDALTAGGPEAIRRLVEIGARFDLDASGDLSLAQEAGHRRRRIVHADGDATGREIMRALTEATAASPAVEVLEGWWAVDLARHRGRVTGVAAETPDGDRVVLLAPAVILATGGIGRLYRHTTNPPGVTGDGLAMAARAGARLADLEFVQFHPTALLASGVDPHPLLTEALRGEGATLVDRAGRRFMTLHHPDAELAPRDIVARAIWWQRQREGAAYLDARSVEDLPERFPTVFGLTRDAGLDPRTDLLPVTPAAHYFMGGIDAGPDGRTSLPGLWAVGEVAATGVHGANRLASNSLLEGLVFGAAVAADVVRESAEVPDEGEVPHGALELPGRDDSGAVGHVRDLMWDRVGLVRTGPGLWEARNRLLDLAGELRASIAGRVAFDVARLVASAALRRSESRGGHYRADYPDTDPFQAARNLVEPSPVEADLSAVV
jgi:L-aspartate oxidase